MRLFLVLFLILTGAVSAVAQPASIVTTDTGSQIFFSSAQVLRGSDQVLSPKIFRLDANGLALVEQRVQEGVPNFTNYFQLTSVDVSGDGSVQAINAERPCNGGSACVFFERRQTTITGGGLVTSASGQARLSRNGRYFVLFGSTGFPITVRASFGDRVAGQSTSIPDATFAGIQSGRAITADGGVLVLRNGGLVLWRLAGETRIPTAFPAVAAVIDDGASTVVYETADRGSRLLRLGGGNEVPLNAGREAHDAQISADGSMVIFLANSQIAPGGRQLFTELADGTGLRQISAEPTGIVQAALAGSGWVAYASTGDGRLIGIDIRTGSSFEFLPPTPSIQLTRGGFAPGSAIRIFGQGFSSNFNVAPSPLPRALAGAQVLLDGNALPIQVVTPTEVRFQLPWELTPPTVLRTSRLLLQIAASPFDAGLDVNLQTVDPRTEPVTPPGFAEEQFAIHENNSSPVSAGSPAKPGEVVHIYLTGLGTVKPPVATGFVTPLSPLSLVTNSVTIQVGGLEAEVLQVRLQPALLGYYMADVRIPTGLAGPQVVTIHELYGGGEAFNVLGLLYVQ